MRGQHVPGHQALDRLVRPQPGALDEDQNPQPGRRERQAGEGATLALATATGAFRGGSAVTVGAQNAALSELADERCRPAERHELAYVLEFVGEVIEVEKHGVALTANVTWVFPNVRLKQQPVSKAALKTASNTLDALVVWRSADRKCWELGWFKADEFTPAEVARSPTPMAVGTDHVTLGDLREDCRP